MAQWEEGEIERACSTLLLVKKEKPYIHFVPVLYILNVIRLCSGSSEEPAILFGWELYCCRILCLLTFTNGPFGLVMLEFEANWHVLRHNFYSTLSKAFKKAWRHSFFHSNYCNDAGILLKIANRMDGKRHAWNTQTYIHQKKKEKVRRTSRSPFERTKKSALETFKKPESLQPEIHKWHCST